jgi:hypothetical protein
MAVANTTALGENLVERTCDLFDFAGLKKGSRRARHGSAVRVSKPRIRVIRPPAFIDWWDAPPKVKFARDSPLEGSGFEPSVPSERG